MTGRILIALSSAILLALGVIHLAYTFSGTKLTPRDTEVQASMAQTSPVISKELTMWQAWIGFNATHSMFLILFGLIYGYLALAQSELLFRSPYLMIVGAAMLLSLLALSRLYLFSIPFTGVCIALLCYVVGIVVEKLRG